MSDAGRRDPGDTYRQEAAELLDRLESALLAMEGGERDSDLLNEAFRALHTIKGSGGMFGFDDIVDFAHHFENAFDRIRAGEVPLTPALIECSMAAADHIAHLLDGSAQASEGKPLLEQLQAAMGSVATVTADATPPASADEPTCEVSSGGARRYHIVFYPEPNALRFGTNPLLIFEELRELGSLEVAALTDRVQPLSDGQPAECRLGWEMTLHTSTEKRQQIDDVFMFAADGATLDISETLIEAEATTSAEDAPTPEAHVEAKAPDTPNDTKDPAGQDTPAPAAAAPSAKRSSPSPSESVRVSAERLDSLMDKVGELVIAQSRLADLATRYADPALRAVSEDIDRLVTDMRDDTLDIRMVPIGVLFSKFRRITRTLSKELGKPLSFEVLGEDTEIDKSFIELLNDPLVHLIRNSMDHGLESPEQRLAAGKPEKGRLRLSAHHEGGEVLITIADDGAGIDLTKVRARAEEKGLLEPDQEIPEHNLRMMIFEPGFSTAASVSNISGRGVGMDVVRRTIQDQRGSVSVESEVGRGTRITLRLPLTLAIVEGFHVNVAGGAFVLPLDTIEECVEMSAADDLASESRRLITIRNEYVPFARLHELFGFNYDAGWDRRVVVVRVGRERLGLVVDEIIGQRQTVIKPLTRLHKFCRGISGATILGDGRVALIVDVGALIPIAKSGSVDRRTGRRGAA
ncbi:MAG: chemotaxis protein CheA [Pseudomonadota bacterium]